MLIRWWRSWRTKTEQPSDDPLHLLRVVEAIEAWPDKRRPMASANLPSLSDPGPPEVKLFREQLVRFRANYAAYQAFATRKLNVPADEITALHLVADLLREVNTQVDPDGEALATEGAGELKGEE